MYAILQSSTGTKASSNPVEVCILSKHLKYLGRRPAEKLGRPMSCSCSILSPWTRILG